MQTALQPCVITGGTDSFLLLDSVSRITPQSITGTKEYANAPGYLLLESMAQLGALHIRQQCDFSRHAFLLSIQYSRILQKLSDDASYTLNGTAHVSATRTAETESTATYSISLCLYPQKVGTDFASLKKTYAAVFPSPLSVTAPTAGSPPPSHKANKECQKLSLLNASSAPMQTGQNIILSGEFTFSSIPYSDTFPEATLRSRYEKVFQCLTASY